MKKTYKLAITTGDKFGIGKELIKKSLDIIKPDRDNVLIIGEKILDLPYDYDFYPIDIEDNGEFCFQALKTACEFAIDNKIKALVTAPVSKYELHKAGHYFEGQTEVIEYFLDKKRVENNKRAQMLFIADDLKVMLLTRHVALNEIKLNIDEIVFKIEILDNFLKEKYNIKTPKIALCALNPHRGENGILGREEIEILDPAVVILNKKGINVLKAQSADALFSKIGYNYINKLDLGCDAVVACYHDQGLCPLKALAFDRAVNTTIGLNIIRTSPTSGTAYDIAGKNIANPNSMVEAIKLALKLA